MAIKTPIVQPVQPPKKQLFPEQFKNNQAYNNALRTGAPAPTTSPAAPLPPKAAIPPIVAKAPTPGQAAFAALKAKQNAVAATPATPAPVSSYEDIGKANIQAEYDKTAKTATDLGLGPTYGSIDEQYKDTINQQREQKALQEAQLAEQKASGEATYSKNIAVTNANTATQAGQLAGSREGFNSATNTAATSELQTAASEQLTRMKASRDTANMAIDQAKRDLESAQKSGNMALAQKYQQTLDSATSEAKRIDTEFINAQQNSQTNALNILNSLEKSGALANMSPEDKAYLEQSLPGAPPGVLDLMSKAATQGAQQSAAAAQYEQTTKGFKTFTDILGQGSAMSPENIQSLATSLNIPTDMAISAYNGYQAIRADKSLSQADVQGKIQDLNYTLQQKARGIFNQAQQNVDYLSQMYASGKSPEEIAAFKSAAGIKDFDDPMYQADLAYKQAQASIEQKRSRGEAVTVQDQIDLMKAQQEMNDLGGGDYATGSGAAFIPSKSLEGIKVNISNGQYNVTVPPDREFQCGAFVNRAWGLSSAGTHGLDGTAAGKRRVVDKYGINAKAAAANPDSIRPGMAFVMPIGGQYSNIWHTGIVKSVDPENGTFTTIEANANGRAKTTSVGPGKPNITSRILSIDQMYGFVPPPDAKEVSVGGKKIGKVQEIAQKYIDQGVSPKAAKAKAEEEVLKGETKKDKNPEQVLKLNNEVQEVLKKKTVLNEGVAFLSDYDPKATSSTYKDQQLIYSYMKVLDPGSVVKETEFQTAQRAQGFLADLGVQFDKATGKAILAPESRQQIVDIMRSNFDSKVGEIDKEIGSKDYLIKQLGYEPEDIYDVEFARGNALGRGAAKKSGGSLFGKITDAFENLSSNVQESSVPETPAAPVIYSDNLQNIMSKYGVQATSSPDAFLSKYQLK